MHLSMMVLLLCYFVARLVLVFVVIVCSQQTPMLYLFFLHTNVVCTLYGHFSFVLCIKMVGECNAPTIVSAGAIELRICDRRSLLLSILFN